MVINTGLIKIAVIVAGITIKQSRMTLRIIPAGHLKKYNALFSSQCAAARGRIFNYIRLTPLSLQEGDQVLYPKKKLPLICTRYGLPRDFWNNEPCMI